MVQQLTKRERDAHGWEFPPGTGGFRIRVASDRENQANQDERERAIRYLATEAHYRAFNQQARTTSPAVVGPPAAAGAPMSDSGQAGSWGAQHACPEPDPTSPPGLASTGKAGQPGGDRPGGEP
jgi:hypothetical protein